MDSRKFWACPAKPGQRHKLGHYRPGSGGGKVTVTRPPPPPAGKDHQPGAPDRPPAPRPPPSLHRAAHSAARPAASALTADRASGAESHGAPTHPAGGTDPEQAGPVTGEPGEAGPGAGTNHDPAAPRVRIARCEAAIQIHGHGRDHHPGPVGPTEAVSGPHRASRAR